MPEQQEFLEVGNLRIPVLRKPIKHVHITVYPPDGRVSISAPLERRTEIIRAFALMRLSWIRQRQAEFAGQARQGELDYISRESHYLWGRRYLLDVREGAPPGVEVLPKKLLLTASPGASRAARERIMSKWQRKLLHAELAPLIAKWEAILKVNVNAFSVRKFRTRWGSCTPSTAHVRFNLELIKKPKDLLEYVVAHELCHLLEPRHSKRFYGILDACCPRWRDASKILNELPL